MSDSSKRRATDAELAKLLGKDFVSEHGLLGNELDATAPDGGAKPGATAAPAAGAKPAAAPAPAGGAKPAATAGATGTAPGVRTAAATPVSGAAARPTGPQGTIPIPGLSLPTTSAPAAKTPAGAAPAVSAPAAPAGSGPAAATAGGSAATAAAAVAPAAAAKAPSAAANPGPISAIKKTTDRSAALPPIGAAALAAATAAASAVVAPSAAAPSAAAPNAAPAAPPAPPAETFEDEATTPGLPDEPAFAPDGAMAGVDPSADAPSPEEEELAPHIPSERFPAASVRRTAAELQRWLGIQSLGLKVGVGGAAALLLLVFGVLPWVLAFGGGNRHAYLAWNEPLRIGPGEDSAFPVIGTLERNETLEVVEEQDGSDFVMVRGPLGQVGFVRVTALVDEPQPTTADQPFTLCRRKPDDLDGLACGARAEQQFEGCKADCTAKDEGDRCVVLCSQRRAACASSCESRPVLSAMEFTAVNAIRTAAPDALPPPEPAAPPPEPPPAEPEAAEEPAADVPVEAPAEEDAKGKKGKKAKKKPKKPAKKKKKK